MKPLPTDRTTKTTRFLHSIQSKIFLSYGSIFLLLILLVSLLYYNTSYENFLKNQEHTSRQLSKIITTQINQYLDSVNTIQKRILESEDILTYIFEDAAKHDVLLDRAFRQNIYEITGYDFDFYHINIYNIPDQTLLTFGQNYDYIEYCPDAKVEQELLQPTIQKNGAIHLSPLNAPVVYCPVPDTATISLLRAFGRYSLTIPKAVIEIQISYQRIQEIITDTVLSYGDKEGEVFISTQNLAPIYPYGLPQKALKHYASLQTKEQVLFKNPVTKKTEMVTTHESPKFGIITALLIPENYLSSNRQTFLTGSIGIFGVSLLLLMLLTYKIAKSISAPLLSLKNRISALELESLSQEEAIPFTSGTFSEVDILNESYNRMQNRLKQSLDDVIASRTLTMHAQLMSLQAQMDSHFLYNTLAIISIIAEENEDHEASAMCIKLTEMLRYTTEDYMRQTTLEQELHHCQNYTDLMSIRFGSKIQFLYEVGELLNTLNVPRLIMQPIVENCVKYSRKEGLILQVSIRIYIENGWWKLVIQDNGDGFSNEALTQINARINRLKQQKTHPDLSIDGLGLANIYLRLKLHYDDQFLFELTNIQNGNSKSGACITIGGPCHEHKL